MASTSASGTSRSAAISATVASRYPPFIEIADDPQADGAFPFVSHRRPELFDQVLRKGLPGRQRAFQRRRVFPEGEAAGVVAVLGIEVLDLDLGHRIGVALRNRVVGVLAIPVAGLECVFLLPVLLFPLRDLFERRVQQKFLLHALPQLRQGQREHLDRLADLGREV